MTSKKKSERFVVAVTGSRPWLVVAGVFVARDGDVVTLRDVRCCSYWSADVRTVLGLGASGPLPGSRVSPRADAIEVKVEALIECSDDARKTWESAGW